MRSVYLLLYCFCLVGCSTTFSDDPALWEYDRGSLPKADMKLNIAGLGPCTDNPDRTLHLNSMEPVTILVHGCFASAGRFRALAEVFAFHGQQAACFNYDDRDSLMVSSKQLISAVKKLNAAIPNKNFTIIGHSQGGLITRKALIRERESSLTGEDINLSLVTISAPVGGIAAADHCGSTFMQVATLGLIVPVCYAISGGKWYEITAQSDFIQKPGKLVPQVRDYLKIVTDEKNTCRRLDKDGSCTEDDYVFSVEEQYMNAVDQDKRLNNVELQAGHVEIVGDHKIAPRKLITILQNQGYIPQTSAKRKNDLENLLVVLYGLK
ncbi:MAG: hydrolase [Gammaproteobacteria bacterium]|nr:hydrolase [Gammaproteobacteria bacterium]